MKNMNVRLLAAALCCGLAVETMSMTIICYEPLDGSWSQPRCFAYPSDDVDCEVLTNDAKDKGWKITTCEINQQPQGLDDPEVLPCMPWECEAESSLQPQ